MRIIISFFLLLLWVSTGFVSAEEPAKPLSGLDAVSYAAGFRLGDTFKKRKVTLIPGMVMQGLEDARKSRRPLIPNGEMRLILRDPKGYLITDSKKRNDLAKRSGESFLQENARQDAVRVRPSGLQYKIMIPGEGEKPKRTDSVRINYQGTTINGQVFDSTDRSGEPALLAVNNMVPGLSEGLQLMSKGGTWEFYVPAELGYGAKGPLANETLVFTVELLEVLPGE